MRRALGILAFVSVAACGAPPPAAPTGQCDVNRAQCDGISYVAAREARPSAPPAAAAPPAPAPPDAPRRPDTTSGPLTPAQIAARARASVVTVHAGTKMGTGFGVRSDGWIATSLHVVAGADAVGITKHDGTERRVTAVRAYDVARDLAVLEAPRDIAILPIAETMGLDVGAPVVAIGNPMGLTGTVSSGLVSGVREIEPSFTVLQISAPIAPGSSGGPILDDHGRVVGVAMATVVDGQN